MYSNFKFYVLVSIFVMIFGTIFCVSSVNWLWVWVGLELNLIGFVPILLLSKQVSNGEGAMKYIIVQSIGSSLVLFSNLFNLIYSSLWVINSYIYNGFIGCLLVVALGIKLGLFPFYYWLPSVAMNCSMGVCAILLTWQKIAPLGLIYVIYDLNFLSGWSVVLGVYLMCAISSLIGGWGGLNSVHFRKIMAYSSVNHGGWIVFGMMMSLSVSWFYMFIYFFTVFVIFIPFVLVYSNNVSSYGVNNLGLYGYLFVLLQFLSLGGLPPLLGFYGKLLVISCSFGCVDGWIWIMVLIFGSLLSLYYYLFLVFIFFLNLIDFKKGLFMSDLFKSGYFYFFYVLIVLFTFSPVLFMFN